MKDDSYWSEAIKERFYTDDGKLFYKEREGQIWWNTNKAHKEVGKKNYYGHICVTQTLKGKVKNFCVHRIIWFLEKGYWPTQIDHIDRNPSNNKIENLREVTQRENNFNKGKYKTKNTSKGVNKVGNRWVARISAHHVKYHIGTFDTEEQAAAAYQERAKVLHGEYVADSC